jgi:DNA polymerase/3'-5' exonuclease PolX
MYIYNKKNLVKMTNLINLQEQTQSNILMNDPLILLTDYKKIIITQLTEIMNERKKTNDVWKARAYKKVIDVLNNVETPITKMEDINDLPGIGKSIKEKIQEIFDNNVISEIKNMSPEEKLKTEVIEKLTKISTIGIKKAEDLYNKHNIRSIEDLKNKQDLLNDKQKIGLFYYADEQKRIPFKENILYS